MNGKTTRYGSGLALLFFVFVFASCAEMFQVKISAPGGNTNNLGDIFLNQETGRLDTPSHFLVSQYFSSTEIRLAWEEVPRAAYYMVERAVSVPDASGEEEEPDEYRVLSAFVYDRFYSDVILNDPDLESPEFRNKYYYRVSAWNEAKGYEESEPTEPQSAMLLRAPGNVQATKGTSDNVTINWNRMDSAVSYEIWRSTNEYGTNPSLLSTIPANQNWYENKIASFEQGVEFYYMVRAMNRYGNRSLMTGADLGFSRVFGAPTEPTNVRVIDGRGNSNSEIKVQWNPVDAAEVRYVVYRFYYTDNGKTPSTRLTSAAGITETSFADKSAAPGIYYYYEVQAVTTSGERELKSAFSTDNPQGFIISPPDTVIAEKAAGGGVTVKWTPPLGSIDELIMYTYNIWSSNVLDDSSFINVSNVTSSVGADGYLSATVGSGTFFKVSTVNGDTESVKSITAAPFPDAAVIDAASRNANIPGMGGVNANGVYPVKITWKKPANDEPAFYNVQRSTRSGAGFSQINDTRLAAGGPYITGVYEYDLGTQMYSYIDRNPAARVGRQFYYRVLSLNQLEKGNFPSAERVGWGSITFEQYLIEFNSNYGGRSALTKLTYYNRPAGLSQLGVETVTGYVSGTLHYNAWQPGLTSGRCVMTFTNYCDVYIEQDPLKGPYFIYNGATTSDTDINANGSMTGNYKTTGMYPGTVYYDNITLRSGKPAGGTYGVEIEGFPRRNDISWSLIAF